MLLEQPPQRRRADLLLALDEHGDADPQVVTERAQRRQVQRDPCLVVGGATPEEPAVALASATKGSLVHAAASPAGCTSWCAYRSTVGAPGGAGRCPTTAGRPSGACSTATSSSPAVRSSTATASALVRMAGAAAGSADTDGIATKSLQIL